MNAVKAALDAARRAQESTYSGVVTVTERKKVRDERSKLTEERDVVVLEGQPCKLSFETLKEMPLSRRVQRNWQPSC